MNIHPPRIMYCGQQFYCLNTGPYADQVVHAGTTEWCVGLQASREEPITERITMNILDDMLTRGDNDVVASASRDGSTAKL